MPEDRSVDIALLGQRLDHLETALREHREESKVERTKIELALAEHTARVQELTTAWNSAILLGKLLGVLGTVATLLGMIATFFKGSVK